MFTACLKNIQRENINSWCFSTFQQLLTRLILNFSLQSDVECLIFSEHSRLQREALQRENAGWLGQLELWFIPGYGLRRTNKDYSVWGIFSSLKLANIFQLVLTMLRLKYCWRTVFRMNDSQCEPGSDWDIDEFDPPQVTLLTGWFITVQWSER